MSNPEDGGSLVELVDPAGFAIGTLAKLEAHLAPGRLHRAVSVFLLDQSGRLLVQRRAAGTRVRASGRTKRPAVGWLPSLVSWSRPMAWSLPAP